MDVDVLLWFDYNSFKNYLVNANEEELQVLLKNKSIKEKIINSPNKYDFIYFAQEENSIFPLLFDSTGIEILNNTPFFAEKVKAILTSENFYVTKLFNNKEFVDLIIKNFDLFKIDYYSLNKVCANILFNNLGNKKTLFLSFISNEAQEYIIDNNEINQNDFLNALTNLKSNNAQKLIDKTNYKFDLNSLSNKELYFLTSKNLHFPSYVIEDKTFIQKISQINDVKTYRFIINNLEKSNDVTSIIKNREKIYDDTLNSYDHNMKMLPKYSELYMTITYLFDNNKFSYSLLKEALTNIFNDTNDELFEKEIYDICYNHDKNELKNFLQKESTMQMTNIIIDYHFEDLYMNTLKDINELLNFNLSGGNVLTKEEEEIYKKIINLDTLEYNEKIKLHNELKNKNYVEKFYDDIRNAKNKMYTLLQNEILTKEKLAGFESKTIDGVKIYEIEDKPFYALVKSLNTYKDDILTENDMHFAKDGASFSIDSSYKLKTYADPHEVYNVMYDSFNINQVVHTFPSDSFSYYNRDTKEVTTRVNRLMMPIDFVKDNSSYNEIVMMQKNMLKPSDIDKDIPILKPCEIYCYDIVTENDIKSAKNLGLDIVVVNTRKYDKSVFNNDAFSDYDNNYMTSSIEHETKRL